MASQWFVRVNGKMLGPLSDSQLRQLALGKKLDVNSEVALAPEGPWHSAGRVRGLFPQSQGGTLSEPVVPKTGNRNSPHDIQEPTKDVVASASNNRRHRLLWARRIGTITIGVLSVAILVWLAAGGGSPTAGKVIEGAVFLVAEDGQPIKLGAVGVSLVSETTINRLLDEVDNGITLRQKDLTEHAGDKEIQLAAQVAQKTEAVVGQFAQVPNALAVVDHPEYSVAKDLDAIRLAANRPEVRQFLDDSLALRHAMDCENALEKISQIHARCVAAGLESDTCEQLRRLVACRVAESQAGMITLRKEGLSCRERLLQQNAQLAKYAPETRKEFADLEERLDASLRNLMKSLDRAVVEADDGKRRWDSLVDAIGCIDEYSSAAMAHANERAAVPQQELARAFAALGDTIAQSKTDGDGRFLLPVPREYSGKAMAIIAMAVRKLSGKEEHHAWAIKVPGSAPIDSRVLLSTDNEIPVNSEQNVRPWKHGPL